LKNNQVWVWLWHPSADSILGQKPTTVHPRVYSIIILFIISLIQIQFLTFFIDKLLLYLFFWQSYYIILFGKHFINNNYSKKGRREDRTKGGREDQTHHYTTLMLVSIGCIFDAWKMIFVQLFCDNFFSYTHVIFFSSLFLFLSPLFLTNKKREKQGCYQSCH